MLAGALILGLGLGRRLPDRPRLRAGPQRRSLRHGQGPGRDLRHRRPGRLAAAHHRDRRRSRPRSGADRPRSVDRHRVPHGAGDRAGGDPAAAGRGHRSARPALPAGRRRRQSVHPRPDHHRAHRAGRSRRPAQPADRRAGQARRGPGRYRRADLPVHPSQRDQAGAARRGDPQRPPFGRAVRRRFGSAIAEIRAPRRACSRSCRAIRPGLMEANQVDKKIRWSVRSSTGWPTDARRGGQPRGYGRQNGLAASAQASARVSPMSRSM